MRLRWVLAALLVSRCPGATVAERLPPLAGLQRLRLVVVPGDSPLATPLAAAVGDGLGVPVALTPAPLRPGDPWAPGVLDEWWAKVPGELLLLDASQADPSWPPSVLAARLAAARAAAPRWTVLAISPAGWLPELQWWLPALLLFSPAPTPPDTVREWLQPTPPPVRVDLGWEPQPGPGQLRVRSQGPGPAGGSLRWPSSGLPEVPLGAAEVLLPTPYPTPWLAATLQGAERAWPLRLAVPVNGLHVGPAPGRSVDGLRLDLRDLAERPRRVVLQGRETLTVDLPAATHRTVTLPLAVPAVGCGPRLWPVGVTADGQTWPLLLPASYAAGAACPIGSASVDGRLDEWRGAPWHTVGLPTQLVDGASAWHDEADLRLRWAVRLDGDDLLLAVALNDDAVTPGDRLLVALDAGRGAALGLPGAVRRWLVPLTSPLADPTVQLARSGADGWRYLELRLLDAAPVGTTRFGWDVGYRDDDPAAAPSEHRWSGDRWTDADPARLPLLQIGETAAPALLFVAP